MMFELQVIYSIEWGTASHEQWVDKDLEGSNCILLEELAWRSLGGDEKQNNSQSR
jgi:hypothetical protein